jgi:hypothetical protein
MQDLAFCFQAGSEPFRVWGRAAAPYFGFSARYVNTPHFEVSVQGDMTLHEDSADGNSFRVMDMASIYSGSFRIARCPVPKLV